MSTHSTTQFIDEVGQPLVTIYRQYDGHLKWHGLELAKFLSGKTLVHSWRDSESKTQANGMGCLAALAISHLKGDKIGNIYITDSLHIETYHYTVYCEKGEICLAAMKDGKLLFTGEVEDFVRQHETTGECYE